MRLAGSVPVPGTVPGLSHALLLAPPSQLTSLHHPSSLHLVPLGAMKEEGLGLPVLTPLLRALLPLS